MGLLYFNSKSMLSFHFQIELIDFFLVFVGNLDVHPLAANQQLWSGGAMGASLYSGSGRPCWDKQRSTACSMQGAACLS